MRLWSIHPKYLDTKGLVALWREGLLAKHVLEGKTKGYKNHPQLIRFKKSDDAVAYINQYLYGVLLESQERGYRFDRSKVLPYPDLLSLEVTSGQIEYEWNHLKKKLKQRDLSKFRLLESLKKIETHPIFVVVEGGVESWEIV
jgi:hypothetical protein